jgi:hypothetical protein
MIYPVHERTESVIGSERGGSSGFLQLDESGFGDQKKEWLRLFFQMVGRRGRSLFREGVRKDLVLRD